MRTILREQYYKIKSNYIKLRYKAHIKLHWAYKTRNFGDILNPILFNALTNKKIISINSNFYQDVNYLMIGSILQHANKFSIVWGSGFISEKSFCKEKPMQIHAVRGKLTRKKLLELGIECPKIYGDPALLMPLFYKPTIEKKYKLGIIPHYVDISNPWVKNILQEDNVLIINLITDNPLEVIDKINSCSCIASSSLHGLIIADTYKIPSLWISLSDNIEGGHFKFQDYFSSVNKQIKNPFTINNNTTSCELIERASIGNFKFDYNSLLNSSPFTITNDLKDINAKTNK